jgi:hypothetical protein
MVLLAEKSITVELEGEIVDVSCRSYDFDTKHVELYLEGIYPLRSID